MRRIINILLLTISSLFLCSCSFKDFNVNRPIDQKNTTWESEDGTLHFVVDEHGVGYGELIVNNEYIKIEFITGLGNTIEIYVAEEKKKFTELTDMKGNVVGQYEASNEENRIESWTGNFKNSNTFTATVKETTYFKVGQKIKINRIDN